MTSARDTSRAHLVIPGSGTQGGVSMGVMGLLQRLCPAAQGPADHEDDAEKSTEAVGPACPTAAPTGAGPGGEPAWVEACIPPPPAAQAPPGPGCWH